MSEAPVVVRDELDRVLCPHGRPIACYECGEDYAGELQTERLLHQETRGAVAAWQQRCRELETANNEIAEQNQCDYDWKFREIEAQRDDLLDALRLIISTAELSDMGEWIGVDVAREAIAKVEGRVDRLAE